MLEFVMTEVGQNGLQIGRAVGEDANLGSIFPQ